MLSRGLFREFLVNMRAGIGPQDLAQHNSGVGRGRKLKGKLHRQVWRLALRGYGNAQKSLFVRCTERRMRIGIREEFAPQVARLVNEASVRAFEAVLWLMRGRKRVRCQAVLLKHIRVQLL